MLNFKRVLFIAAVGILLSCQTENKDSETIISTEPQIVSSELQSYFITDNLVVNSVVAILYNPGEAKNYRYIVELQQGEESWIDTIAYYANANDTARHQVIFAESIFSKENPAVFNATIKPVEENR